VVNPPVVNPPAAPRLDLSPLSEQARAIFIVNNLVEVTGFATKWVGVITVGGAAEVAPFVKTAAIFWNEKIINGLVIEATEVSPKVLITIDAQAFLNQPAHVCATVGSRAIQNNNGIILSADMRVKPSCLGEGGLARTNPDAFTKIIAHEIGHAIGIFGHVPDGLICLMSGQELWPDLAPPTEEFLRFLYSTAVQPGARLQ